VATLLGVRVLAFWDNFSVDKIALGANLISKKGAIMSLSGDRILRAVSEYRKCLSRREIGKSRVPDEVRPSDRFQALAHVHAILEEVEQLVGNGRMDAATRLVCFSQGVLWREGLFTRKELKAHNRARVRPLTER
jgi:hypothetical protein